MWVGIWERAQNVKIFVLHVNGHQRVPFTEEAFNNHVDRFLPFDVNKSLPPDKCQHSCLIRNRGQRAY